MTFMVVMAVCDCNGHSGDNYDIFGAYFQEFWLNHTKIKGNKFLFLFLTLPNDVVRSM